MRRTIDEDLDRRMPSVPKRAATAIVRVRRDVIGAADEIMMAIQIFRHLEPEATISPLEDHLGRLEAVGSELGRIPS